MKKIFLSVFMVMLACSFALSQDNVFKINILSPVIKTLNLQYERKLNATSSFQLGFFYTGYSEDGEEWKGFGVTPEYRFYLSDTEAPEGFFVAPFIRYMKIEASSSFGDEGELSSFGGGLILGKQWIFKEKVALDIFLGPNYLSGEVDQTAGTGDFENEGAFSGFGIRFGVCFGLAF